MLNHVGFTSNIPAAERPKLTRQLEKMRATPGYSGKAPGGPSQNTDRSSVGQPLEPKLVVEVRYDHVSGDRFRHSTRFVRWRPDGANAISEGLRASARTDWRRWIRTRERPPGEERAEHNEGAVRDVDDAHDAAGKGADALDRRPQLAAALAAAHTAKCSVLVSKLDRLSRDVAFVAGLMAQRVPLSSQNSAAMPIPSCSTCMRPWPRRSGG